MTSRLDEMKAQCQNYHIKYPEVWDLFVKFTNEIIDRGYDNYSVNAVFERIRWEIDISNVDRCDFKINNNYRPLYARRFMKMYPKHDGFFRTRKQTSEEAPATNKPELRPKDFI